MEEGGAEQWLGAYLKHCKAFYLFMRWHKVSPGEKKGKDINAASLRKLRLRRKQYGAGCAWWGWGFRAISLPAQESSPQKWSCWWKWAHENMIKEWFMLCARTFRCQLHEGSVWYIQAIHCIIPFIPGATCQAGQTETFSWRWNLLFIGLAEVMVATREPGQRGTAFSSFLHLDLERNTVF